MGKQQDLLQGTLDLLILRAVSLEPVYLYGILLRIQQSSENRLQFQQGSLYRLEYRAANRTQRPRRLHPPQNLSPPNPSPNKPHNRKARLSHPTFSNSTKKTQSGPSLLRRNPPRNSLIQQIQRQRSATQHLIVKLLQV